MYKFKFADIGEGLHEGKVGEIYFKVGDNVKEGDSLFSVETDKVTSDIPSPVTGVVKEILIKTGETVHVGDDVFHFETEGDEAPAEAPKTETKEESVDEGGASVVGEVKVSNELFSIGSMFSKKAAPAAPKAPVPTPEVKTVEAPANNGSFDINAINPTGNGEKVDVVVIGAGPGGYTVAELLGHQGLKTVVIEKEYAGGVCLNVGCIPTKTLLKSSKVLHQIEQAESYGLDIDLKHVSINWDKMQERKNNVRMKLRKGVEMLLNGKNTELIIGEAEVVDKHNVKVGSRSFTTKVIILATGSSPIVLPLDGFDSPEAKKRIIDSTGALDLKEIPKSLVIVGGGVIGLEFAMLYNELGTKVTVLEGAPSILGPMDNEVKNYTRKILKETGVEVLENAKVQGFKDKHLLYEFNGKQEKIESDKILVSVGRRPNNLGLDKTLGIKLGKRGEFVVNDFLQTSISNVFAIGDSNAMIMLAHVAYKHAHVLASFLNPQEKTETFDIKKVPSVVYTHPEISSIGLTEEEVKEQKLPYVKSVWQNAHIGRVLAEGDDVVSGFTKLLVHKETGAILGAHIINGASSEMITEIAVAIELESTIYELANTIHPHPTISEGVYEAAVQATRKLNK